MSINIESSYSFNGSLIKESSLDNFNGLGYKALGLVDTSTAFFLMFYKKIKSFNIKPILGLRLKDKYFDIILYPKNYLGYQEVLKYASIRNLNESLDYETLIMSTNILYCLDITYLENDNLMYLNNAYNHFKENNVIVYTGIDFSYYPCEVGLYPLIKDRYKTIIINKVKYLNKEDKKASEVLEAILSNTELSTGNLFDMGKVASYHLKPYNEFVDEYNEYPELLKNTFDFIDSINVEIEFKYHFPKFDTKGEHSSIEFLTGLSNKGLLRRLEGTRKDIKKYKERLNYELDIINGMGFTDYFLVVYDYILFAKKQGIYVGPGRGSGASSLVSYTLGIIDIDPLEYDLYFERFLNPSRKTMPDIDTDFEDTRKNEVIRYCMEKYGENHVSLVMSYQTLLAKGTIRDVSKVLQINSLKADALSKEIDSDENSIDELMKKGIVQSYYENDNEIKELIDISRKIEGVPKSTGIHASAVIICDDALYNYTEIHKNKDGFNLTVFDADSLKTIGLVKMDFLSLSTLSDIHNCVNEIESNKHVKIDINKIPLTNEKTYTLFREKSITGIFQFETPGMTNLIKKIKPVEFKDLSIATAIYRPGSNKYADEYISRRNRKSGIEYYDPCLKDILMETSGIIVYQEQIMKIINVYSGLSLAEADILRRAISDKDINLLKELENKFYKGAEIKNRNKIVTKKLFDDILQFAGYGFNKAHSIAYAKISYIAAYLKANYTQEFMANLFQNESNKSLIMSECSNFNLKIITPDIRLSSYKYKIYGNNLVMPFNVITGIGIDYSREIENIVHENENEDFSFENIISRSKGVLPRSLIESLIFSGTFDYTGYNKKTMIEALDGLFEFDPTVVKGLNYKIKKMEEYDFDYLKSREYEYLGYNPKYHPLFLYTGNLKKISNIELGVNGVTIIAYLTNLKINKTKTGDSIAVFDLEDEFKQVKSVMFTSDYHKYSRFLKNNTVYEVFGSYKMNREKEQFIVRSLKVIENV